MLALLLDTETTGLIENRSMSLDRLPEVIEFYGMMADLDKGKKKSEYHTLIKPSRDLIMIRDSDGKGKSKKTITEITGIDNTMLKDAPPFEKVAKKVFDYIEKAPVVIAQNASFDKDMLDIEAIRLGKVIKWPPIICTIEQSVHYKGFRLNLADLHLFLTGESFAGAHRAKADVEAMLRCCVAMRKRGDL